MTRAATVKTLLKNPAGSSLRCSFIGSQGRCPRLRRSAMKPMARPNGVDRPGNGSGVMKGSESRISSSV